MQALKVKVSGVLVLDDRLDLQTMKQSQNQYKIWKMISIY
jgi:hypothetical protein